MEKRHFTRTGFITDGTIRIGSRSVPFTLIDVSLKGALIEPNEPQAVPGDSDCELAIRLPGSSITITALGICVHSEARHRGIRFTSIDADSMTHLRRLLELNTGRGDRITRELSFLVEEE